MRVKSLLLTLAFSTATSSVLAATGGVNVDWQKDYDDVVKSNCTGLVIAGSKVLTAAHCLDVSEVNFANGSKLTNLNRVAHPNFEVLSTGNRYDIAIWDLPKKVDVSNIHFIEDLTTQTVKVGDQLKAYGFGGNNPISYVLHTVTKAAYYPHYIQSLIRSSVNGNGMLVRGDSGGMWLNKNNRVVSVFYGGSSSTDLFYGKNFILEQVNGWHYPTIAKTVNGKATITVQSLHQNNVVDTSYSDGGISLVGGTCRSNSNINPFELCTYEIEGNEEGHIFLSSNEVIHVNKPSNQSKPNNGNSSGGSMSWLFLGVLGLVRIFKK